MNNEQRAILVAQKAHANQSYDIYPYTYHTQQVAQIAKELGYGEAIILGCHLHDTIEDGDLSYSKLKKAFGVEVAEIVYCVTDGDGRNRKEKKAAAYKKIRSNWKAVAVKLCDRIANMEHSKEYNSGLFQMYVKEFEDFQREVYNPHHPQEELAPAWERLAKLIEVGDQVISL